MNWLARKAKDLPQPRVVTVKALDHPGAAAVYWRPGPVPAQWKADRVAAGEQEWVTIAEAGMTWNGYDLYAIGPGLLMISSDELERGSEIYNVDREPGDLAHEWFHHWQAYNIGPWEPVSIDPTIPYRDAIVKFFRSCPPEAAALRFQLKVAPDEESRLWGSWLGWNVRARTYFLPRENYGRPNLMYHGSDVVRREANARWYREVVRNS